MLNNAKELLDTYNIDYKSSGQSYKIFCPYHDEKNSSFFINKEEGFFHCFSCGRKGSYKDLYELISGQQYKYDSLSRWVYSGVKSKPKKEINTDIEIKVFGKLLNPLDNVEIREWLRKYGVEKDEYIEQYEIKYSSYTEMIAKHLMVDSDNDYTKMVNRITTPIYKNGKIINYEGRTYKNANPKILYVRGGSVDTLYNWNNIDINKPLVVCEGIKGLWRIHSAGIINAVAMMHNISTDFQLELLNSVNSDIIVFLDNDYGGFGEYDEKGKLKRKGTIQGMVEGLKKDFKLCYSPIKGYDPNDCSIPDINKLITNAKYYSKFDIDKLFTNKIERW